MYQEIGIQGNIEVKGRNGYFKAKTVEVMTTDETHILFFKSARAGGNSPMTIRGTKKELTTLLRQLTQAITAKEERDNGQVHDLRRKHGNGRDKAL